MPADGRQRLTLRRAAASERKTTKRDWVERASDLGVIRLLAVLQPLGILLTLVALALNAIGQNASRSVAAWNVVLNRTGGAGGKLEALQYLNAPWMFGLWGQPRSKLDGIRLTPDADGTPAILPGVDLRHASLKRAQFAGAILGGARFDGADLGGASFENAELTGASFRSVQASGMNLRGARLLGADFSGSFLADANFDFVQDGFLKGVNLILNSGAIRDAKWGFANALLIRTEVSGSHLTGNLRGIAWADQAHPAVAVPPTLKYFLCPVPPLLSTHKLSPGWTEAELNIAIEAHSETMRRSNCREFKPGDIILSPNGSSS